MSHVSRPASGVMGSHRDYPLGHLKHYLRKTLKN